MQGLFLCPKNKQNHFKQNRKNNNEHAKKQIYEGKHDDVHDDAPEFLLPKV